MFSKRQNIMLSYILYHEIPIKLEILAEIFNVSVQTIRVELENIDSILHASDVQVLISKGGYCFIETDKKEKILKLLTNLILVDKNNIENHTVWNRINTIIGILAFESDYISMEALSERLYVSKSTINLDITEVKKIMDRMSGITFIVSNQKGLKLKGREDDFRYMLSKLIVQGLNLESSIKYSFPKSELKIQQKYFNINQVLRKILVENQHIISGKAFGLVCASFLICNIRNELGFQLDQFALRSPILPMMKKIEAGLEETGIRFMTPDLVYMQNIILEQNHLNIDDKRSPEDIKVVSTLTYIVKELQIELKDYDIFEKNFTFYINQLNQRVKNAHDYANFFKRQINRLFPMTASIVAYCREQLKELNFNYSDAELAYITLFLGNYIETKKLTLKLLFISDEHTALVNWIISEIYRMMGKDVHIIKTIPRYVFEEDKEKFLEDIDVVLTTENISIDLPQSVIFIQSLFGDTEKNLLSTLINNYLEQYKKKELRRVEKNAIGENRFISIPDRYKDLVSCIDYILKKSGIGERFDSDTLVKHHLIPNDSKVAYLSLMTNRKGTSAIYIGKLSKSIHYKSRTVNTIIISLFHFDDYLIAYPFYNYIRFLTDPAQSSLIGKVRNYTDFKDMMN
ncbi:MULTISPECIES: BglG family transcription antiterminator [unclassified Paenibacillus]|uniref:BglG family transcription antiterminator n=1 Tax=unclassified Paenibacillus TaxID=185978 RepID=UPI003837DB04